MLKKLVIIPLIFIGFNLMGQDFPEGDPIKTYSETITKEDMQAHLYFLADDLLEGRETGERGQHIAGIYIRAHFMRLGLIPGNKTDQTYFQKFYLNRSEIKDASLTIGKQELKFGDSFLASGGMADKMEGEMVFAGFGFENDDYNNLEGLDLEGKIAVIVSGRPNGMPSAGNRFRELQALRNRKDLLIEKGAKAVLIGVPDSSYKIIKRYSRRSSSEISASPRRGSPLIFLQDETLAQILNNGKKTIPEIREALAGNASIPKNKLKKKSFSMTADVDFKSKEASNVMGYLEGTDKKDELLVITGHYDHVGVNSKGVVYNGADDDGSGTTAVLELAEAFATAAKEGYKPRRSILFMTVSGEEKGLLGSEFYANNPIYPLENTITNLNIDMIGRVDKRYEGKENQNEYIYLIGSDKLSSELHELSEEANDTYSNLTLDYKYNDENDPNRFYYRSDHYNFAKNGIPIIFYFNGTHEDYHQPGDDPEKIAYQKMQNITRLVFATAWKVANRDERVVVDKKD
ncbi:MAG: M28 family peptidase [Bacteroidia bacterium]|nr:M28 family peptidase [Bacteroidia bacterium]